MAFIANQLPQFDPWAGQKSMAGLINQNIQNMFSPQMYQQSLMAQKMANALQQKYGDQQAAANLSYSQAQTPYLQASTALTGQQAKYYGPEVKSRMGLQNSQTRQNNFYLDHPEYLAGGAPAQAAALMHLQQTNPEIFGNQGGQPSQQGNPNPQGTGGFSPMPGHQAPQSLGDIIKQSLMTGFQKPGVDMQRTLQLTNGASYLNAPRDIQKQMLAQASALGMDSSEAMQNLLNGKTLEDMAKQKGFNSREEWPEIEPEDYAPTQPTITANQKRNSAIAELKVVSPFMNAALGPYSRSIGNMSIRDVIDKAKLNFGGDNPSEDLLEKQANFVAAGIISQEYNAIRLRSQGVTNIGIEGLREVGKKSLNEFANFRSGMSEKLFKRANDIANDQIEKMNRAANKAVLAPFRGKRSTAQNNQVENSFTGSPQSQPGAQMGTKIVKMDDGSEHPIDAAHLDAVKKKYADHIVEIR